MDGLPYKGLIFDMDGTLTVPTLDFSAMRREIGIASGDIAHAVLKMPEAEQRRAWSIIEAHERRAVENLKLQDGCAAVLGRSRERGLKVGILTRNARYSVDQLCLRFGLSFDAVVTREFEQIKPHPAPVLHILKQWGMRPAEALVIGDYIHDVEAGRAAGTRTCFYHNAGFPDWGAEADFKVSSMGELEALVLPL